MQDDTWQDGYDQGHEVGWDQGYAEGFSDGAAERQALRADRDELQCTVTRRDIAISGLENQVKSLRARVAELEAALSDVTADDFMARYNALRSDAERYRFLRDRAGNAIMQQLMADCVPSGWNTKVDAARKRATENSDPASLSEGK